MTELAAQLDPGHASARSSSTTHGLRGRLVGSDPLLAALKDEEAGGLYVYPNEGQRGLQRHDSPPIPLVSPIIDHNGRNTRPDRLSAMKYQLGKS
jgi:hypothetical protein